MIVNVQELDDLKKQLEEERKKKKELVSANVKLNGMLKVGQDAIKAEQDMVKTLQEQLDTISSHGSQVDKTVKTSSTGLRVWGSLDVVASCKYSILIENTTEMIEELN